MSGIYTIDFYIMVVTHFDTPSDNKAKDCFMKLNFFLPA